MSSLSTQQTLPVGTEDPGPPLDGLTGPPDRPRVLLLDDSVEFRMIQLACTPDGPTAWLDAFVAPEGDSAASLVEQLFRNGRPWSVAVDQGDDESRLGDHDPDVLVVERRHPTGELLDRWSRLRGVVEYGSGSRPDPAELYRARGLQVRTVRRATTDSVADHAMLLLLALARRLTRDARLAERPSVSAADPGTAATPGDDGSHPPTVFNWLGIPGIAPLAGRRFAVLGAGEIGASVLRRAYGFGMTLGYASRSPRPELETELGAQRLSVDELPRWADIVSLHVPYSRSLHHVVDARFLELLGPAGILVNTARGLLVDHAALVTALRQHEIAGAGLDVHATEPLPDDDPLRSLPNAILTPHVGAGNRWTLLQDIEATIGAVDTILATTVRPRSRS